jgi:hypothetical protein
VNRRKNPLTRIGFVVEHDSKQQNAENHKIVWKLNIWQKIKHRFLNKRMGASQFYTKHHCKSISGGLYGVNGHCSTLDLCLTRSLLSEEDGRSSRRQCKGEVLGPRKSFNSQGSRGGRLTWLSLTSSSSSLGHLLHRYLLSQNTPLPRPSSSLHRHILTSVLCHLLL